MILVCYFQIYQYVYFWSAVSYADFRADTVSHKIAFKVAEVKLLQMFVADCVSGECSEDEVVRMFLQSFESPSVNGELSFREFEEYYEGLSVSMDSDDDFCSVLRNAWSI